MRVAIIGTDALAAEPLLEILAEREWPADSLTLLSSEDDEGGQPLYNGKRLPAAALASFDFRDADVAVLLAAPADLAGIAERILAGGCHLIDASGDALGRERGVPVVPAVNAAALGSLESPRWLLSPGPLAVLLGSVLQPLAELSPLNRVDAFVCRAVSSCGSAGVESLAGQAARLLNGQPVKAGAFAEQIAFNLLPQPADSAELAQLQRDIRQLTGDAETQINLSEAVVPVFYGHSVALRLEAAAALSAEAVREQLSARDDLHLVAEGEAFSPVGLVGDDRVHIGHLQLDEDDPRALRLWVIADNLRKGAALNIIQIMEILIKSSG